MAKADFLKKRADEFFETADYHLKKHSYSLAAFDLEQTCQLYLKYYLFLKIKDFPKTHFLRELLKGIEKAYNVRNKVKILEEENVSVIGDLEQAYLTSRYLPSEFTKFQVEKMREFVRKLIEFLKNL